MALPSSVRRHARSRPRAAVITDALSEASAQAVGTPSAPGNPEPVIAALRDLGYDAALVEFSGNVADWLVELATGRFQLVFNLCEGLRNQAAGEPIAAGLVELLGLPLTGASSDMLALCLRKDRANAVLHASGVPVPKWILARPGRNRAARLRPLSARHQLRRGRGRAGARTARRRRVVSRALERAAHVSAPARRHRHLAPAVHLSLGARQSARAAI